MLTNLSGKKKMNVREGNTGILYYSNNNGYRERYIPDCDLDKAGELLIEFQELKEKRGKYIKDIYWDEGFNWFPTGTNDLFSTVFFPYIKYKPIVDKVINGEIKLHFENNGSLFNLINLFEKKRKGFIKHRLFNTLIKYNNRTNLMKC